MRLGRESGKTSSFEKRLLSAIGQSVVSFLVIRVFRMFTSSVQGSRVAYAGRQYCSLLTTIFAQCKLLRPRPIHSPTNSYIAITYNLCYARL